MIPVLTIETNDLFNTLGEERGKIHFRLLHAPFRFIVRLAGERTEFRGMSLPANLVSAFTSFFYDCGFADGSIILAAHNMASHASKEIYSAIRSSKIEDFSKIATAMGLMLSLNEQHCELEILDILRDGEENLLEPFQSRQDRLFDIFEQTQITEYQAPDLVISSRLVGYYTQEPIQAITNIATMAEEELPSAHRIDIYASRHYEIRNPIFSEFEQSLYLPRMIEREYVQTEQQLMAL